METEKTDEDLEALIKWMGKGANNGYVEGWLSHGARQDGDFF